MTAQIASAAPTLVGWCSRSGGSRVAHFLEVNGRSACAERFGPWGVRMGLLFTRPWRELDPSHSLCAMCREELGLKPRRGKKNR